MSNFDWQNYDESPVFKQGIAIVRRFEKFGAIMVGGKEIVPPIYNALSEFKDGYAVAKWKNEERVVNLSGQIQVLKDNKEIFLPEEYDWGFDFIEDICIVVKNGKYGIIDSNFNVKQKCEYEYIEALSDSLFKFREHGKWGLINKSSGLIIGAEYIDIFNETRFLLMVKKHVQNGSSTESRYGLLDCQGNVVISAECKTITKTEPGNNIFFIVEKNLSKGVLDEDGNIIVPFIYDYISVEEDYFYCSSYHKHCHSIYKFNGERSIYIDKSCSQMVAIPVGYEYAAYVGYGIVKVSQSGNWGLIDILGNIITEPQYSSIDIFDGSFAKVGKCVDEKKSQYGFIDTSGEVVLPIEYDEIEKWDNGYYIIKKNELYGLLSPTLYIIIEPSKHHLKKLDDQYILVNTSGLMDYLGNELIPADGGYNISFTEIEVLENGFLKVIYNRGQWHNSRIGILNSKGKKIYVNNECDDITYLGNGLLLVDKFLYTSYDGAGHSTYNIVNFQGKELFYTDYDYIEVLKNGNILICKRQGYGMAKNTGEIFVSPKYANKINFENGIAEIKISENDHLHKINEKGQVIVLDEDKNEVIIPKDYYWGTDFINGISIVRTTTHPYYSNDAVGVINKIGEVVIPAKYNSIELLSDNTLLVNKDGNYGLFDITGKCILPDIFTTINHISKDRIRVIWNLDKIQSWSSGEYMPGPNKYLEYSSDYMINNRSALCDTKGNIINDKSLLCVGKFQNGYARCYLNIEVENNNVKLKQVGIIDINGQTIVSPEYDGIILYNHNFARLRKGKEIGIADLKNRKTILFNDINIKKPGPIDSFGRFIYVDGNCHNDWSKSKGVLGPNGVILSSGKYSNIELLENGLIKVSNKEKTLFGLLGLDGKELLKMEYSYISSFKYGYATICIGGHKANEFPHGKWGVIDKTGKFIIECIHDEKQILSAEDIIKYNLIDNSEFDSYGRLLFNMNRGNIGVIGLNSVIVPIGKYPDIQLLENGLIKVSNKVDTFDCLGVLYGLLDADGKELLEMKYSYISPFINGYASICIGGYDNHSLFSFSNHIGGKWGVIDKTGKIVIECVHDEEQQLTIGNIESYLMDEFGDNILPILCSDYIPINTSNDIVYDCYDDSDGYNDETTDSIYDNPYYNDNLDMDQQSIEFWNSL